MSPTYAQNKEHIANYQANNVEHIREYKITYQKKNPEIFKLARTKYYQKCKETGYSKYLTECRIFRKILI